MNKDSRFYNLSNLLKKFIFIIKIQLDRDITSNVVVDPTTTSHFTTFKALRRWTSKRSKTGYVQFCCIYIKCLLNLLEGTL